MLYFKLMRLFLGVILFLIVLLPIIIFTSIDHNFGDQGISLVLILEIVISLSFIIYGILGIKKQYICVPGYRALIIREYFGSTAVNWGVVFIAAGVGVFLLVSSAFLPVGLIH